MTITTGAPAGSALGTRDDYADAIGTAIRAAAAYYGSGDSPLDDASFDLLVSLIQAYEDRYPEQIDPATPTGEVAHTAAMLSPANAFGPQDLLDWEASVVRRLGAPVRGGFVVEPKLDGALEVRAVPEQRVHGLAQTPDAAGTSRTRGRRGRSRGRQPGIAPGTVVDPSLPAGSGDRQLHPEGAAGVDDDVAGLADGELGAVDGRSVE